MELICIECRTRNAKKYYGLRKKEPKCETCYQKVKQKIYREKNKKRKIQGMWGYA